MIPGAAVLRLTLLGSNPVHGVVKGSLTGKLGAYFQLPGESK